jgi:Leucine-rich repeat (LRR) protein
MNNRNRRALNEAARYGITNLNARRIELSGKGLTKIPDFVFYMKNLEVLLVDNNNLLSLPERIGQLKSLKELRFHDNKLSSLPAEIGQLKKLYKLDLSKNKFTVFPSVVCDLKNLKVLWVDNNNLLSLPERIGQLKNLEYLLVGKNNLTTLPESIGQLKKLRVIYLFDNITSLPESFKNLPDDLDIYDGITSHTKKQFMKKFVRKRINKNTELLNSTILPTNNIPRGKRVYLNIPSNVKNNGTIRRVYNKNGINQFIRTRSGRTRLHGNNFTEENVKTLNNKNFNLQRIRVRLLNTPLNNMKTTIEGVKNRLPPNVSRTDVNNVVRKIKPLLLNKIRNKLRTTPANNRRALLNRYKRDGLINNRDVL